MQRQKASTEHLPAMDEGTLQQLLAAAWVMQEHNDRLLARQPSSLPDEKNELLGEIVEVQNLIQGQQLDLRSACGLIAQALQRMVHAKGAAISCIQNGQVRYLAALGNAAANDNLLLPPEDTLGYEVLRTGRLLQSPNPESDPRIPREVCRKSGVKSLVVVPVFHDQRVEGVLELQFAQSRWLPESELRLCQLMAGLVTEAMVCAAQLESKRALFSERTAVLQALEQIKPQLERMATPGGTHLPISLRSKIDPASASRNNVVPFPASGGASALNPPAITEATDAPLRETPPAQTNGAGNVCRGCGHKFVADESFCGACGITRRKETNLQGKWASLWYLQQAHQPQVSDGEDEFPLAAPSFRSAEFQVSGEPSSGNLSSQISDDAEHPSRLSRDLLPPDLLPHDLPKIAHNFIAAVTPETIFPEMGEPEDTEKDTRIEEDVRDVSPELAGSLQSDSVPDQEDMLAPSDVGGASELDATKITGGASENTTTEATLAPWTSAARARSWLESVRTKPASRAWFTAYRANIYLFIAAALLLVVVSGLGTRSLAGHPAALQNRRSTQPKLTWLETMMVNMGLAVPPPSPDYADPGNPNTQVWLDIHTALYYCPGSELYGKTPGGRFAAQQDAQQDQFEPALRRACN